jgi:two-component system, OmpR family, sensor histidine kinase KdpD
MFRSMNSRLSPPLSKPGRSGFHFKRTFAVLLNLLANAAVHGGPGGRIVIRGIRERRSVVLAVEDEGPGIPPDLETRIFETFARGTGDDRSGGSGLGFAIAKAFADAMGIGIAAANVAAGGARFSLTFAPNETLGTSRT